MSNLQLTILNLWYILPLFFKQNIKGILETCRQYFYVFSCLVPFNPAHTWLTVNSTKVQLFFPKEYENEI